MAKVKLQFNTSKVFKEWQKRMKIALPRLLKEEIIDRSILAGKSPVKPGRRFDGYSPLYKSRIKRGGKLFSNKRISPVNLKLTGKLLSSFTISTRRNIIKIAFEDNKAEFHDSGKGRLPQRKMLPTRKGERFSRQIEININRLAVKILNLVRRQR